MLYYIQNNFPDTWLIGIHMTVDNQNSDGKKKEIYLYDIVIFFYSNCKYFVISGLAGAIIGFGGWHLYSNYSSVLYLQSRVNHTAMSNSLIKSDKTDDIRIKNYPIRYLGDKKLPLNYLNWKMLKGEYSYLARDNIAKGVVPTEQEALYKLMSSEEFWEKSISPEYILSKADPKELMGSSKDIEFNSGAIAGIKIKTSGATIEQSNQNAKEVARFIREAGAYLQLRGLIRDAEIELSQATIELETERLSTEIVLKGQTERLKGLDDLYKRNLSVPEVGRQISEVNDTTAKYLPLNVQIIAKKTEIDQLKYRLRDLSHRGEQIKRVRIILNEINPKIVIYQSGILFLVLDEIINKIIKTQSDVENDDVYSKLTLNIFLWELNLIKNQFQYALVPNDLVQLGKPGLLKMVGKGFLAGVLLCFVILISAIAWKNIKNNN